MHPSTKQAILVTGPARSGKSEWAEILAANSGKTVIYIATATLDPTDTEWLDRIQKHQQRRPTHWKTLEAPSDLAATLQQHANPHTCLLVDSLGTWVAGGLQLDDNAWEQTVQALLTSLAEADGEIIFVAEETGWGLVPAYPIGRQFRDRLGSVVRRLGAICNSVYLITAGHVLNLSQLGSALP